MMKLHNEGLMICTTRQILIDWYNRGGWDGWGGGYVARMKEKINTYRFLLKKSESDHWNT